MKAAFIYGLLKRDIEGYILLQIAGENGIIDSEFFLKFLHPDENFDNDDEILPFTYKLAKSGYNMAIIALFSIYTNIMVDNYDNEYNEVDFIEKVTFLKKYLNKKKNNFKDLAIFSQVSKKMNYMKFHFQ